MAKPGLQLVAWGKLSEGGLRKAEGGINAKRTSISLPPLAREGRGGGELILLRRAPSANVSRRKTYERRGMAPLPKELQHLKNLIDDAEGDTSIQVLRTIIKSAADRAPAADVVRLAKAVLQCGMATEQSQWANRN